MTASSNLPKRADDHIPFCRDQGIPYLAGAGHPGLSIQAGQVAMPADGIVRFAAMGWLEMEAGAYQVLIANHTASERTGIVANADRESDQITVQGPTAADVLDICLFGPLSGQLS